MAITDDTTASAVNRLLLYLMPASIPEPIRGCIPLPSKAEALIAAQILAGAAYKRLGAGISAEEVRTADLPVVKP